MLYDDRDVGAGVKLNDMDLIGLPVRVIVSERNLKDGVVEVSFRRSGRVEMVSVDGLVSYLLNIYEGFEEFEK